MRLRLRCVAVRRGWVTPYDGRGRIRREIIQGGERGSMGMRSGLVDGVGAWSRVDGFDMEGDI